MPSFWRVKGLGNFEPFSFSCRGPRGIIERPLTLCTSNTSEKREGGGRGMDAPQIRASREDRPLSGGRVLPAAPWVTSSDLAAHAVRHCCQGSVSPLLWLGALTTAVNLAEIWALLRVLCGASPRTRALALDGTRRRHQSHAMDCKLFLQLCRRCRRGAPRRSRRFGNQRLLCGAVRRHGHCLGSG